MTAKTEIIYALRNQSSDWIRRSASSPTRSMTRINVLLHWLVLRERGETRRA